MLAAPDFNELKNMEPELLRPVMLAEMTEDVMETYNTKELAWLTEMLDLPRRASTRMRRTSLLSWGKEKLIYYLQRGGVPGDIVKTNLNTQFRLNDDNDAHRTTDDLSYEEALERVKQYAATLPPKERIPACVCWTGQYLAIAPEKYNYVCEKYVSDRARTAAATTAAPVAAAAAVTKPRRTTTPARLRHSHYH